MRFTKMHGLGNDYVYVDGFHNRIADPRGLAVAIADRHFGVGGDGLILILPPDDPAANIRMRMFNADGSESEMCGNGVRCVAKYAWDHGLCRLNPMKVQTGAGVLTLELELADDRVRKVRVDMGRPRLAPADIPVNLEPPVDRIVQRPITVDGTPLTMTCVSMGNPHAVFFVDDIEEIDLDRMGPRVELHPMFPRRTNVHFVEMNNSGEVTMKTWERGSGITLACGTGASAVCVAGVLNGLTDRKLVAHLPGGDLELEWSEADDHVYMTGPATEVFTGDWPDAAV